LPTTATPVEHPPTVEIRERWGFHGIPRSSKLKKSGQWKDIYPQLKKHLLIPTVTRDNLHVRLYQPSPKHVHYKFLFSLIAEAKKCEYTHTFSTSKIQTWNRQIH